MESPASVSLGISSSPSIKGKGRKQPRSGLPATSLVIRNTGDLTSCTCDICPALSVHVALRQFPCTFTVCPQGAQQASAFYHPATCSHGAELLPSCVGIIEKAVGVSSHAQMAPGIWQDEAPRGKHCSSDFHPQPHMLLSSQKTHFQIVTGPKVDIVLAFNHVA